MRADPDPPMPVPLTSLVAASTLALTSRWPGSDQPKLGTGFFVTADLVATCAHVVARDADSLPATVTARDLATGRTIELHTAKERYFRDSSGIDLAFLTVAATDSEPRPYVLLGDAVEVGDELWTYGYPADDFRAGQPATTTFEGWSRRDAHPALRWPRMHGTPVKAGTSGSPVLNRRTGAVCGLVVFSDQRGSAHLLPADEILRVCPAATRLTEARITAHRAWLAALDDDQLLAGGWSYPRSRLRAYFAAAQRASEAHPYHELFTAAAPRDGSPRRMPALSTVYVFPSASDQGEGSTGGKAAVAAIPASAIFDRDEDCLIVGSAGAGKSSLLRVATLESMRRWGRDADRAVPVRVRADALLGDAPFPELIADGVNTDLAAVGITGRWSPEFFLHPPMPGVSWLVLVDGLDEIVDFRQRQAVIDKIAGFRESLDGTHRFIIATRPLADLGLHFPDGWSVQHYRLLPFSDAQFRQFAVGWLEHLDVEDPPAAAERLLGLLLDSGRDRLFRIPLIAMMACQLFARDPYSPVPSTGIEVYTRFVDLLRDRFFESGIKEDLAARAAPFGDAAVASVDRLIDQFAGLVRALAWLHRAEPEASITGEAARRTAGLRPTHVSPGRWTEMVVATLRRTGLLIEYDDDFDFLHESLAEFLAADHVAHDEELSAAVLPTLLPERGGDWPAAQAAWQHPFARFVIHRWSATVRLDRPLRRVVRLGGLHGCAFVATLAADGLPLSPRLVTMTVRRLRKLGHRRADPSRRRTAVDVAAVLDPDAGARMLVGLALDPRASAAERVWAITRLATLVDPRTALRQSSHADEDEDRHGIPRWVFPVLAGRPGELGADLLARLARGPVMEPGNRRLAAEALHGAGDARAAALLVMLAQDTQLAAAERRWAAQAAVDARPATRRLRRRVSRLTDAGTAPETSEILEPLLAAHRAVHPTATLDPLRRAFDTANRWHAGEYRASGDPYVTHPLAVATILASLGMDTTTLVAALLHDAVGETGYSAEAMEADFGSEALGLVQGVIRLDGVKAGTAKAETVRQMLPAMTKDVRVLVIKLADRLHNMRTLHPLSRAKQEQKATETLDVFVPLADRLGIHAIKWELEDLAFGMLFPTASEEINRLMGEHQPRRAALLEQCVNRMRADLRSAKIGAELTEKPEHLYAIHQRATAHGHDPNDVYQRLGVRIVVDTVRDCFAALGVLHANWQPVPGRLKDYITMPKPNLYQSLHTTVTGPAGRLLTVQIRTAAMHRTAEFGIAAHWRHDGAAKDPVDATWVHPIVAWQRRAADPAEFLEALRAEPASRQIHVFTPKGDVIPLEVDATPVDFAYAVRTEVGHRCIGARVNGKLVPLEATLAHGDVVEIFTSKSSLAGPTQDWLAFVTSPRARTKIRQFFNQERRTEAIELGKEAIVTAMRRQGLPLQRMLTSESLTAVARGLHLADVASLYAAMGEDRVSARSVVQQLVAAFEGERAAEDITGTVVATRPPHDRGPAPDPGVVVEEVGDVRVRLARCCTPVPGDAVLGLVTRSGDVRVHRDNCAAAERPERLVEATWRPGVASTVRLAVQIEALDRRGLLADIAQALSECGANIHAAVGTTRPGHGALFRVVVEVTGEESPGSLIKAVGDVAGVYDAYRTTTDARLREARSHG